MKFTFLFLFLLFQLFGIAQMDSYSAIHTPLSQAQRFESLIMLHKKVNNINNSIPGYRVQIYFESGNYSKSRAVEVKDMFESNYPGYNAYVSFNEPYYRVRVGDFRTKIEAIGFLKIIIRRYSNAFEVKDQVYFNDYKPEDNK